MSPLTRVSLLLMKTMFTVLAKSILVPLGLMMVASVTDAAIQLFFSSDMGPSDLAKQKH